MKKKKEWIPGEGEDSHFAPFDRTRADELLMSDDAYVSEYGTDGELAELRAKIEGRRFAVPKKGMKTPEEIRARLADFETRFEARAKAGSGRTTSGKNSRGDKALELEGLGSWAGALRWVLGEEGKR